MSLEQKLLELKRRVQQKKEERIRAESLRDQALESLHKFGYDTVEEAQEALEKMKKQIASGDAKIEQLLDKLEEDFPDL